MSEYWIINLLSVSVPLLSSFHPKLQFHKKWKFWIPSILFTAFVFLVWDAWFTAAHFWWFNPKYIAAQKLWGMPLEEWAFFICIPYASIFTYKAFEKLSPKFILNKKISAFVYIALAIYWVISLATHLGHMYTVVCHGLSIAMLLITWYTFPDLLRRFIPSFLVLLIPFVIVNGILTGSFNSMEIVSYDNLQTMGVRFINIPIEDFSYAFSMLLMSLLLIEFLEDL